MKNLSAKWRGKSFWPPAFGKQGGVIFISDSFNFHVSIWKKDTHRHILSLLLELTRLRINLVNVYAPTNPGDRKGFLSRLHEYFFPSVELCLAGDFNSIESKLVKRGGNVTICKQL